MQELRDYQVRAVDGVHAEWTAGRRAVCLVSPTGSGKTRLGEEFVYRARAAKERVLWIAHRRELLKQAAARLALTFSPFDIGIIAPGEEFNPAAEIQIATVQTLLARDHRPDASLLVWDECHHVAADEWREVFNHYSRARALGLTATPERQDGKPLGDMFDGLVVAATYSELIKSGHLVPCRVYQPPEAMGGNELARDPLEAWQRYADGSQTFVFCASVEGAYELAKRFGAEGVAAETVEAKTKKCERDEILGRFAGGRTTVLTSVFALTEGIDIPTARCAVLARGCGHVGPYLQMVGRVLRPAPGKADAILIDLTGATLVHGLPTEDREYGLDGSGIRRTSPAPLRNCVKCGATILAAIRTCPECGFVAAPAVRVDPRIYSLELREVYAGADTPSTAKEREYKRLRQLGRERGWAPYFVQREYKKLFGEMPVLSDATELEMRTEYTRLRTLQQQRGYKPGFVAVRFKEMFGKWPPRSLRDSQTVEVASAPATNWPEA